MGNGVDKIEATNIIFHERIGEGGFGTVKRVTFKKPYKGYKEAAAKSVVFELGEKEVQVMSRLQHPNIVTLLGICRTGAADLILMEYAPNGSLRDYLKEPQNPLPSWLQRKWSKESATALQYLHQQNYLHRDIKPQNCLLFENNVLKLCDFGLAQEIEASLTISSQKGTYRYMAPEIIVGNERGRGIYSKQSDIWSYGMLLLEICTRKPPFADMQFHTMVFKVGGGAKPSIPGNCPKDLSNIMQRCWENDQEQRIAIEEVIAELSSTIPPAGDYPPKHQHEQPGPSAMGKENLQQKVPRQEDIHLLLRTLPVKEIAFSDVKFHEHIGRGRFSVVSRVTLTKPCKGHAEAAAKKILIKATDEIEILSSLCHQHIASVFGFGYFYLDTFLFLELAPYGSLHDHLIKKKHQPIPGELNRKWMKEAALAIEYLHGKNILHIVFHNFTLKLCDFGLASKLTEQGFTQTTMKGTWMFWAPEIIKPSEGTTAVYSKPSDIFAYGMLLLEICSRGVPFPGKNFFQYMMEIYEGTAGLPTIPKHCPQDVPDLMRRCWNHEPAERPTIEVIIEELAYWELVSAETTGLDTVNANATPIFHERSVDIGTAGGKIEIPNTGVSVKIPEGAITDEEPVEITASVHWDKEHHHTLQGNEFVIGPAIHCKPDGLTFKKPVQITFPHSAENISAEQLAMWTRKSSASGNHEWQVIWGRDEIHAVENEDGADRATIIVESNKIKLRVYHFSGFSISYWWNWLLGTHTQEQGFDPRSRPQPILRWMFLTFMQPANLANTGVFIKNVMVMEKETKACQCAARRLLRLNLTEENTSDMRVGIHIKAPLDGWEPLQREKKIEYPALQFGESDSNCFAFFTKKRSVDEIMGTITAYRGSDAPIAEIPFSNTMCNLESLGISDTSTPITDDEIHDVANQVRLSERGKLYRHLGLSDIDIETAEYRAISNDAWGKAVAVLMEWRKIESKAATRDKILEALDRCRNRLDRDELRKKWGYD